MTGPVESLVLCCAAILAYVIAVRHAPPTVARCPRCHDLVQFTPGLPTRCPSCGRLTLI